jgi:deoxyribonuclease-4
VEARCDAPLGFCIDTAHSFEAGYDVSTKLGLRATVRAMRFTLGMESVCLLHANDSKTGLGSNRDRHESIGDGHIGSEAFARMLRHPQLRSKPFILETPFIDGSHRENVRRLWALAAARAKQPGGSEPIRGDD